MAKLGRYSADRKKIENLACGQTSGADGDDANVTHNIEAHDCGTIFTLTPAAAGDKGGATITLPTVAQAGKGWWAKFVLLADIPADTNSNDDLGIVIQGDASDSNDIVMHQVRGGVDDAAVTSAAIGQLKFVEAAAKAGDQVEFICDGDTYLALVHCAVAASVVAS